MTAVIAKPVEVTEPGVYDLPEEAYFADPVPEGSLSTSGAKLLLECPAKFEWARTHPEPHKRAYDLGHVAHRLTLGKGADFKALDFKDYKTKAAQLAKAEAYAAGKTPILRHELDAATEMAAAVLRDPLAGALFNPKRGKPEQSLFWRDPETGVMRRARLDWLPDGSGRRFIVPDLKTANSADPRGLGKVCHNFDYAMQADAYLEAVRALGLAKDPSFVFVFVEKAGPFLVQLGQLDAEAMRVGRERNRRALEKYVECRTSGVWPGYTPTPQVVPISLPSWAIYQHDNDF